MVRNLLLLQLPLKNLLKISVDAGATQIEVLFKDKGFKRFQVSDNGCGIKQEDLENICLKGFTSKIEKFEDICLNLRYYLYKNIYI